MPRVWVVLRIYKLEIHQSVLLDQLSPLFSGPATQCIAWKLQDTLKRSESDVLFNVKLEKMIDLFAVALHDVQAKDFLLVLLYNQRVGVWSLTTLKASLDFLIELRL